MCVNHEVLANIFRKNFGVAFNRIELKSPTNGGKANHSLRF